MKKLICGLLAFLMILSFAACGDKKTEDTSEDPTTDITDTTDPTTPDTPDNPENNENPETNDNQGGNTETNQGTTEGNNNQSGTEGGESVWDGGDYDVEAALNSGVIFSALKGAEKEAFLKACEENGITVTFKNGTTIMTEEDGYKLEQDSDGTLTVTDADGFTATISYKWGKGPLAKMIPEPKFGKIDMFTETDEAMIVQLSNVKTGDFTTYAGECKKLGFNDVQYEETTDDGSIFVAANKSGYTFAMSLEDGTLMISLGISE